jgi:hypothetical protein
MYTSEAPPFAHLAPSPLTLYPAPLPQSPLSPPLRRKEPQWRRTGTEEWRYSAPHTAMQLTQQFDHWLDAAAAATGEGLAPATGSGYHPEDSDDDSLMSAMGSSYHPAFAPAYYGMIADVAIGPAFPVAIGPGIPVHTMNGDCAHRWGGKPGKYSFQLSHVCFRPPTTVSDVLRECTARCIVQQVRVAAAASRHVNTHSRVCAYVLHVLHQHETSWTIFNRSNHPFTAVLGDYLPPEARVWGRIMLPFDDFLRVACWKLSEPAHHAVLTHRALTGLSLSDPSIGVLIGWHVETPDARFTRNLNKFLSDLKATRDLPDSSLNGHSLTSRKRGHDQVDPPSGSSNGSVSPATRPAGSLPDASLTRTTAVHPLLVPYLLGVRNAKRPIDYSSSSPSSSSGDAIEILQSAAISESGSSVDCLPSDLVVAQSLGFWSSRACPPSPTETVCDPWWAAQERIQLWGADPAVPDGPLQPPSPAETLPDPWWEAQERIELWGADPCVTAQERIELWGADPRAAATAATAQVAAPTNTSSWPRA